MINAVKNKFAFGLDMLQICYRWTCVDCDITPNISLDKYQFACNYKRLEALKSLEVINDTATNFDAATMQFDGFYLIRVHSKSFAYCYNITVWDDFTAEGERKYIILGTLGFGRYAAAKQSDNYLGAALKVWIKLENKTLYNNSIHYLPYITETIGLDFNNITAMDLCLDAPCNFSNALRRLIKDKDLTIILNGKELKDRKKFIEEIDYLYKGSADKINLQTVYVKERNAIKSETKGKFLKTYNKTREIEENSKKDYINEPFGKSKIFRFEVHLNWDDIKPYLQYVDGGLNFGFILNNKLLYFIFCDSLNKLIHFRINRTVIDWFYLLGINFETLKTCNRRSNSDTSVTTRKKTLKPYNSKKKVC